MTVKWRRGSTQETILCDEGTFFVGYSYTDANGYHIASADNENAFAGICKHSARCLAYRVVERAFSDGAVLRLHCLATADQTIRAVMQRCAGIKQSGLSCNGFSLTVTV